MVTGLRYALADANKKKIISSSYSDGEPTTSTHLATFDLTAKAWLVASWIVPLQLHQGVCYCLVHLTSGYLHVQDTLKLSNQAAIEKKTYILLREASLHLTTYINQRPILIFLYKISVLFN